MAGKDLKFSLIAKFQDKASRGVKRFFRGVKRQAKRANTSVGRGGLAGMMGGGGLGAFGGFAQRGAANRPGGLGGMVSGVMQGATRLLTMPAKIVSSFARIIPAVGGVFSGLLSTVTNIFQGIADTAANVVGTVINVFTGLANQVGRILGTIAKRGSQAFLAVAGYATYHAAKIGDAWNEVRTIIDLGGAADRVKGQLRDLAIETGRSLQEVIGGYYEVLSAGISEPRKAMQFLETSLKGAVGGAAGFGTVVQALSRTLRVFEVPVEQSRKIMDQLLRTVDLGQIKFPELANAIGPLATAVKAANGELKGALASLGMLAQTGPVDIVATQLRGFFLALAKPARQTQKVLADLQKRGLDLSRQALGRKGLVGYLRDLDKVDQGTLQQLFPDRRAFLGAKNLLSMIDEIEGAISGIGDSKGKTESNFQKRMDSLIKQAWRVWRAIQDLLLAFGTPIADKAKEYIKDFPSGLKEWRGVAEKAGTAVAKALDAVLQKGKKLWQFFTQRDWTWKGLTDLPKQLRQDVLPKIIAMFGKMTDDGFEPGPALNALVAAFRWAAAKIEGILSVLWEKVGRDLKNTLASAVVDIGRDISRSAAKNQEDAAAEWYDTSLWTAYERRKWGPWEDQNAEQREGIIDRWGKRNPVQAKQQEMIMRAATAMQNIGAGIYRGPRSEEEKDKAADKARAAANAKATKAAEDLSAALNKLGQDVDKAGGAAAGALDQAAPKKTRQPDGGKKAAPDVDLSSEEAYQRAQAEIGKADRMARMLQDAGEKGKASKYVDEERVRRIALLAVERRIQKRGRMGSSGQAELEAARKKPYETGTRYAPVEMARRFDSDPTATKAVGALERQAKRVEKMQQRGMSGDKIAAAARDFSERVVQVMESLHESQDATEKHLKEMERRVDRLATARTR